MNWMLVFQLHALFLPGAMPPPPPSPAIFQQAQEPRVLPSHRHGPHEGEPGAVCYRGETQPPRNGRTLYHCECQFLCETDEIGPVQREADECETSCGIGQCACHGDETCMMPIESPK